MATRRRAGRWALAWWLAGGVSIAAQGTSNPAVPPQAPMTQAGVKIAPRDVLVVTVINAPDYSGKFQVGPDGSFEYPTLGRVKAAMLTVTDVTETLRKGLGEKVFRSPQVVVELEQSAHARVIVLGAVSAPATYPFAGEIAVLEALAKAGSVSAEAGEDALVVRAGSRGLAPGEEPDGTNTIRIDLAALLEGDLTQNVALRDGDTLIVLKSQPVFVMGYVNRPGQVLVKKGTTVEQAVTLAGGLSDQGTFRGLVIRRPVPGQKDPKTIKASKTDIVLPGDTIEVKRGIIGEELGR